jgi:hypothetical protein
MNYIESRWGPASIRRFIDALIVPRVDKTYDAVFDLTPAEFDSRSGTMRNVGSGQSSAVRLPTASLHTVGDLVAARRVFTQSKSVQRLMDDERGRPSRVSHL